MKSTIAMFAGLGVLLALIVGAAAAIDAPPTKPGEPWSDPIGCVQLAGGDFLCGEAALAAALAASPEATPTLEPTATATETIEPTVEPTPTMTDAEEVANVDVLPGTGVGTTANNEEPTRTHNGWMTKFTYCSVSGIYYRVEDYLNHWHLMHWWSGMNRYYPQSYC